MSHRTSPSPSPSPSPTRSRSRSPSNPHSNSHSHSHPHPLSNHIHSTPTHSPQPIQISSNSAASTPSRSDTERKSFQGDHHRHRFMSFDPSQLPISSSLLGAPQNAHYSPHYGPTPLRAPTSKRKPPPPISAPHLLPTSSLSPNPSPNFLPSNDCQPSPRSHSRSPSPSPSPRAANLARKIGSVLSAPFRSAPSRRGSDASDPGPGIGLGIGLADRPRSTSPSRHPPIPDRLPSMPSPATPDDVCGMTPAERVAHAARTADAVVVVPSHERVLRVVNGTATSSTRASSAPPEADARSAMSLGACARCSALDARLDAAARHTERLEQLVADQTARLEQTRNWITAKVATLEQALRAHEQLLGGLEGRLCAREGAPEVKSDYLIGLQRDVYDLVARMGVVELQLQRAPAQSSRSSSDAELASTKPTSLSTSPPSHRPSPILPGTPTPPRSPAPAPAQETPHRARVWQPSSPAHLASKLVSPKSRPSPQQTPSSRSPRPRYTTALGLKPTSPLKFTPSNSAQRLRGRTSETSPSISNHSTPARGRPSVSNPTTPSTGTHRPSVGQSSARALRRGMDVGWKDGQLTFESAPRPGGGRRSSRTDEARVLRRESGQRRGEATGGSPTRRTTAATRMAFGTRVVGGVGPTGGQAGLSSGVNSRLSRPIGGAAGRVGASAVGVGVGAGVGVGVAGKKKPVGDLIKMFDGGQKP